MLICAITACVVWLQTSRPLLSVTILTLYDNNWYYSFISLIVQSILSNYMMMIMKT